MKPSSEALAYRIWALCQPRGWGMTLNDCAEELGENLNRVRGVAQRKGWGDRFKDETSAETYMDARRAYRGIWWRDTRSDVREAIKSVIGHSRHEGAE